MRTLQFKTIALVAGLAGFGALSVAHAESSEWNYPPRVKFQSTLSRDEVRTEFIRAAREGTLPVVGEAESTSRIAALPSTKTRADVNAEYLQAINEGSLPIKGEDSSPVMAIAPKSELSRQAVIAETLDWMRAQRSDVMMGGN